MNEDLITSQECYADSFISTIFGYLLINRNTRFVSLRNCAISEEEINEAIAYAKQINEIGKEYFTIKVVADARPKRSAGSLFRPMRGRSFQGAKALYLSCKTICKSQKEIVSFYK